MILVLVLASAVYGAQASDPVTVSVTVDNFISISNPGDLALANIAGTGGSSSGSVIWSVTTNNSLGYKLEVKAGGAPALTKGADSFADYSLIPAAWSVPAANSAFGFSYDAGLTYRGFNGVTPVQVLSYGTPVSANPTTIMFKAEVGTAHLQTSGTYTATITATATTL
ncbi:MAG: hypothetical protein ACYDGS_02770 [Thermoleophilia bacterium]